MSYTIQLLKAGIDLDQDINIELLNALESFYKCDDPFVHIQEIYSILSLEVDDCDYYDLGYDEDNYDLVQLLNDYCLRYDIDYSSLAVYLGRLIPYKEERAFSSYEQLHLELVNVLKLSARINDEGNHIFLNLALNDIVLKDLNIILKPNADNIILGSIHNTYLLKNK